MRADYNALADARLHGAQLSGNVSNWMDPRGFRSTVRVRAIIFI